MKEFITYLIKNLVDQPDDVNIDIIEGGKSTIIEVKVDSGDIAKVVGRQGRTINALRTVAMTVGARFDRRIKLELINS